MLPVLALVAVLTGPDPELQLEHRIGDRVVARSSLVLDGAAARGLVTGTGRRVEARLSVDGDGRVESYFRELRAGEGGPLISKWDVRWRADGLGYRVRQENPLGSRETTLTVRKVYVVLDPDWPESVVPWLLSHGPGSAALTLDVLGGSAMELRVESQPGGGRKLAVPGGGPILEVDGESQFRRLQLPGDGAPSVVLASAPASGATTEGPAKAVTERDLVLGDGRRGRLVLPDGDGTGPWPGILVVADARSLDPDGREPDLGFGFGQGLAEALASAGAAVVLRVSPLDISASADPMGAQGADVVAAIGALRGCPEVDPKRVFVVSQGTGALVAAATAGLVPGGVQGLVAVSPPARSLRHVLVARLRSRLRSSGHASEALDAEEALLNTQLDAIRDAPQDRVLSGEERWLQQLLDLRPPDLYLGSKVPVLALFGEADEEIPAVHRSSLQTAVTLAAPTPMRVEVLPGLDGHLSRSGGRIDADALARIRHFLADPAGR